MFYFLEAGRLEIRTKFNEILKINYKIRSTSEYSFNISHFKNKKNKTINHLKQKLNDFKIQLARKIRTDILSLHRKMSSLGAPDCVVITGIRPLFILPSLIAVVGQYPEIPLHIIGHFILTKRTRFSRK